MTPQNNTVCEGLATRSHYVALPYRADGVARALRQTYPPVEESHPPEMLLLLSAIDRALVINARG